MKRKIFKCEHKLTPVNELSEAVANYKLTSSFNAFSILTEIIKIENLDIFGREYFLTLGLNRSNRLVMYEISSNGGISGTVADIKLIARGLILSGSVGVILMHNHPSGNNQPSEADINLTKKMKAGFQTLEIPLLDHIIVSPQSGDKNWTYFSFADEGKL